MSPCASHSEKRAIAPTAPGRYILNYLPPARERKMGNNFSEAGTNIRGGNERKSGLSFIYYVPNGRGGGRGTNKNISLSAGTNSLSAVRPETLDGPVFAPIYIYIVTSSILPSHPAQPPPPRSHLLITDPRFEVAILPAHLGINPT